MLNNPLKRAKVGISLGFILILSSCGFQADKVQKLGQYFEIESFISQQITILSDTSIYIQKEMELDDQKETATIKSDSVTLAKEFQFWIEADINKSANRDAFTISVKNSDEVEVTRYLPKDESSQRVKLMEITRKEGKLEKIEILYEEENSIYFSERKLLLILNDEEIIEEYIVSGYQKMILKTPIQYIISGKFSKN